MYTFQFSRVIDELGRVVLPIEMRKALHLKERDHVLITLNEENGTIVLTPKREE